MGFSGHENGNMEIAVGPPAPVSSNPAIWGRRFAGLWVAPKMPSLAKLGWGAAAAAGMGGEGWQRETAKGDRDPHRHQETHEKRTIMMGR